MKPQKIRSWMDDELRKIARLAEEIDADHNERSIHEFRVSVKMFRAVTRCLKHHTGSNDLRLSGKFKLIYNITGGIRDAQLVANYFAQNDSPLANSKKMSDAVTADLVQDWKTHYNPKIISALGGRLQKAVNEHLPVSSVAAFCEARTNEIATIAQRSVLADENIHDIRKLAKDILYAVKFANKHWDDAGGQIEKVPQVRLTQLADDIGKYNDERLMLSWLRLYLSSPGGKAELVALKKQIWDLELKMVDGKAKVILGLSFTL